MKEDEDIIENLRRTKIGDDSWLVINTKFKWF